jgi:heme/copper-type cytochrome/quinol oxidase subunit 3
MSIDITKAHQEDPDVVGSRNRLGVILIIVADVAMALSVLFVYFYLKGQNVHDMWLPAATEEVPATIPVSSIGAWNLAAVALLGMLLNRYALKGARSKNHAQLMIGTLVAFVFSAFGLVYQIQQLNNAPFTMRMGAYASCYYLIAGLNALHFLLTAFIALGNWNRARLGLYKSDHWHVAIIHVWWIWMSVSAILGAFALSFT